MSTDVLFDTASAVESFPLTVVSGRWVETDSGEEYVEGDTFQNVAGWQGIVLPSGKTAVKAAEEVLAALNAANVQWEYWT